MTELEPLAAHVAGLRVGSMPDDVRASARLHVLDSLAAALAAVGSDVHRALAPVAHDDAAAIASTGAALAHRWELDDIDDATLLCLGGLVVPVAVALGRERRASGPETLAAVVAGYEAAGRLGRALRSADLLRRGWWPSAVCGAFGAAATAARLLALDAGGTREALALALQHTGGLGGGERGAHGRLLLYAAAARAGIMSARAAGAGMRGPSAILGGPLGIAAAYAIEVDPSPLDTPAAPDVISGVTIKPWACARQLHAAVEAALELRESRTGPIDEVVVSVPPASAFVDRPSRDQGAAGSAQWVIATALVRGSVGLGDLAEDVPDADEVARLARRVRVEAVDAMPALAGAVAVRARGSTARHEVLVPRGGRQRPLDAGDVRAKASTIVQRALCDRAPAFVDAASTMDDRSTLDALSAWWESIAAR